MRTKTAKQVSELDYIVKMPMLENSQDYAFLRQEGLKQIEKLGHKLWTDYNTHDPGVTFLELLCYAITDLGFRTGYDVKDLLSSYADGITVNNTDFHTARDILTSSAVTFDDLRKLLIDIHGVRNAWIEPHCSIKYCLNKTDQVLENCPGSSSKIATNDPLNGLYDIFIEYESFVQTEYTSHAVSSPVLPGGGNAIQPGGRGIRFDVLQGLYLESVTLYPNKIGEVNIELFNDDGKKLKSFLVTLNKANKKNIIKLGVFIPAGKKYRLEAHSVGNLKLYRTNNPSYPYGIENQITLTEGAKGNVSLNPYYFFYDWKVAYINRPDLTTVISQDIISEVKNRVHSQRNLCEDVVNICNLNIEDIAVCADIETEPGADLEDVLAEMFYQLELYVSPVVNFYTIDELVARGKRMDEIFEGPMLEHGFIDDEEFARIRRRCEIRASDVINIIMGIPLVKAVKSIALLGFIDGEFRIQEEWLLSLAMDQGRVPKFSPGLSKIVFFKNGFPYYANRIQTTPLLKEKRAGDLHSKLKGHENDLPVPVGEYRDPSKYYPIQNELPITYRVGGVRVEESQPALRKAQSQQLKAYLMFFEQLLANYLAQLANARELFSWQEGATTTYFSQMIKEGDIKDLNDIYNADQIRNYLPVDMRTSDLEKNLTKVLQLMAEDSRTAEERKSRFLDHLVGRFCERFTDYSLLMYNLFKEDAVAKVNDTKKRFLQEYPLSSRNRGQGYNYAYPSEEKSISGYQRRLYGLIGIKNAVRRNLSGHRFFIESAVVDGIDRWHFILKNRNDAIIFKSIACISKSAIEVLLDFALGIGGNKSNYKLDETESRYNLVRLCDDATKSTAIGYTTSKESWDEVVSYFKKYGESEGCHVIEHILLRKRTSDDPFMPVQINDPGECDCINVEDPYSFRMTLVLPSWSARFNDMKFRRFAEETLRREAPAHIFTKICWISHAQMMNLEVAYNAWAKSLAALDHGQTACRDKDEVNEIQLQTGALPLPATKTEHQAYSEQLDVLIKALHGLVTIYPLARLHGCSQTVGDDPVMTLDNSTLGTF